MLQRLAIRAARVNTGYHHNRIATDDALSEILHIVQLRGEIGGHRGKDLITPVSLQTRHMRRASLTGCCVYPRHRQGQA
jgi:hypothetical protein